MSNEVTSPETGVTPAPGQPVTGTPGPASETQQKPTTTLSLEDALARIAELEKHAANKDEEAKRHYKRLSAYEQAEKEAEEARLSELEKATKRATAAEQQIQQYKQQLVTTQIKLAAQVKGIIDPDLAALAIQNNLEYGENGLPTNIDKALKELVEKKPFLLTPKPAEPMEPAQPAEPSPMRGNRAPAVPAMNPGRTNIPAPGSTPPGRIPRLSDPGVLVPPGTVSRHQP